MKVDDRLVVLAALLHQGRVVHGGAMVCTVASWGLVATTWGSATLSWAAAGWAAAVFMAESWCAARVGLDARLFDALAAGVAPSSIDRGLTRLGLVAERPSRTLDARIAGAVRLWRTQLAWAALAAGTTVVVAVTGGWT